MFTLTLDDPLIGTTIADRYEIDSLINSGGMGAVYRAKQHSLGRDVAIKFLRPELVDTSSAQRFMSEARAASRMNHPHVVSVFDFGRTSEAQGELLFLVMELVTGLDLCDTLTEVGMLPLSRIPVIVSQTLQALGEAHHHGIIHRDVKPANILLALTRTGADHVKVIDFGIARVQSERRVTDAHNVCGTAEYLAPESALGAEPGPAADLYSVGVVLFQLLTGKLPFQHATAAATLLAHVAAPRPDPRKVAPERNIPAGLAEVCLRALAICPEERFESAEAFERAIRGAARELDTPRSGPSSARSAPPERSDTLPFEGLALPAVAARNHEPLLLGRDAELVWARAHLREAHGSCWLELTGRPGIGRTRLLHAIEQIAEEEGSVAVPLALDPAPYNELSYRGLRQLVLQLTGLGLGDLDGHDLGPMDERARDGLRSLSPSAITGRSDPVRTRKEAAAVLAWAARRACSDSTSGRVVVIIDDIDRLDTASRSALLEQQICDPIEGFSIVSSAERPIAPGDPGIITLELAGLSRKDALRMMDLRRAEGSLRRSDDDIEPLYVEQISRLSSARANAAPSTLSALVEWQVNGLSAAQRRLLQAVAAVGVARDDKLDMLLSTARETNDTSRDVRSTLMELKHSGMLTISDDNVVVSHQIHGRVALVHAPGGVIAAIHAAAEQQLSPTRPWLELRAYHAIRGAADFKAFLAMEEAARLRAHHGDATGAIALLWQAVSAARVQIMRDEGSSATAALSVFGRKLATALINEGRLDEAQGILDEILTVAEPTDLGRALVLEQLAAIAHLRGRPVEALRQRREALAIAERCGDDNTVERLRAFLGARALTDRPERRDVRSSRPSGRPPVLVVEDDRAIREGLQSAIESDGREAFGAANGKAALKLLRDIPRPGLILLDLMMPVMTGWELLDQLRCDEALAAIPVVVVSAVSKRDEPGAVRVIQKPIEINTLLSLVQEFCG